MKVSLNYGEEKLNLTIPDNNYSGTLSPKDVAPVPDPIYEVKLAMSNPIGSKRLKELVRPDHKIVIIVSDITRPSPSSILLPPILGELREVGIRNDQIRIIFGLGVHRKHTEEEKKHLVGDNIYQQIKCIDHDINNCVQIGITKRGNKVSIFKEVLEADFIIGTANIEYHYFAGYSGGAKSLAPGICSRDTISNNHKHFLEPGARAGVIQGNPVREEIEEIGEMKRIDFIVNAVLNTHKEIVKVIAGDVTKAHRVGTKFIGEMFSVCINELADIVITSAGGYPKDIDLYQTHKAMENASLAVKKGGSMIVVGECRDGLGEGNFADALMEGLTPHGLIEELKSNFVLGRHKASRIAKIHLDSQVYLVSKLNESIKKNLFLKNYGSLEKAFTDTLIAQGENAKVLVIPFGGSTLPSCKE